MIGPLWQKVGYGPMAQAGRPESANSTGSGPRGDEKLDGENIDPTPLSGDAGRGPGDPVHGARRRRAEYRIRDLAGRGTARLRKERPDHSCTGQLLKAALAEE